MKSFRWLVAAFFLSCGPALTLAGEPPAGKADAHAATSADAAKSDPWSDVELVLPERKPIAAAKQEAPPASDREIARKPTTGIATPDAGWVRTTLSLGIVVAAILGLSWLYRFVTNGRNGLKSSLQTGVIEVVGQTRLSPRQSLVLVRVGTRMVLLGCANDSIRALDVIRDADVTARIAGRAQTAKPDAASAQFAACLEEQSKPVIPAKPSSTAAAMAGRLTAVLTTAANRSRLEPAARSAARKGNAA